MNFKWAITCAVAFLCGCYSCASLTEAILRHDGKKHDQCQVLGTLASKLDLLKPDEKPSVPCRLAWNPEKIIPGCSKTIDHPYSTPDRCIKDHRFSSSQMLGKSLIIPLDICPNLIDQPYMDIFPLELIYVDPSHAISSPADFPIIIHVNDRRLKLKAGVVSTSTDNNDSNNFYFVEDAKGDNYILFSGDDVKIGTLFPVVKSTTIERLKLKLQQPFFPSTKCLNENRQIFTGLRYLIYQDLDEVTCKFSSATRTALLGFLPLCPKKDQLRLAMTSSRALVFLLQVMCIYKLDLKIGDTNLSGLLDQIREGSNDPSEEKFERYADTLRSLTECNLRASAGRREQLISLLRWITLKAPDVFYLLDPEFQTAFKRLSPVASRLIFDEKIIISEDIYERLVPLVFQNAEIPLSIDIPVGQRQDQTTFTLIAVISADEDFVVTNVANERVELSYWDNGIDLGTFNFDPPFAKSPLKTRLPVIAIYKYHVPLTKTVKVASHEIIDEA